MSLVDGVPRVTDVFRGEAEQTWSTPFGMTGRIFSGDGIEVVWVRKDQEQIDADWFSQETVDLLLVVDGRLRVEFAESGHPTITMAPDQMLILPPKTKCRAYRWPRVAEEATMFIAVSPQGESGSHD